MKALALVELAELVANPSRVRKVRRSRKKGGPVAVHVDKATARILRAAGRGGRIPKYWIGVPYKKVPALERALKQIARDKKACDRDFGTCWEEARDKRGRRRRCRQRIRGTDDLLRELDEAIDGELLSGGGRTELVAGYGRVQAGPAIDYMDDFSPVLADLRKYLGRRGRGVKGWRDSVRLVMPRSRRWEDVEPAAVRRLSEYFEEALSRNQYPGELRLALPAQTQRFRDAEKGRGDCADAAEEATARALREAAELVAEALDGAELADLEDVPF